MLRVRGQGEYANPKNQPTFTTGLPSAIERGWKAPSIEELNNIYSYAAAKCRANVESMAWARKITAEMQTGNARLISIWQKIVNVSTNAIKQDFDRLKVSFDLWHGESRVQEELSELIASARLNEIAEVSEGALVLRLYAADGTQDITPLILEKSEGGVVYAGTDLATIVNRIATLMPDVILYIVDQRQHLHFEQVFRSTELLGIVKDGCPILEHVGFGSINGTNGKYSQMLLNIFVQITMIYIKN